MLKSIFLLFKGVNKEGTIIWNPIDIYLYKEFISYKKAGLYNPDKSSIFVSSKRLFLGVSKMYKEQGISFEFKLISIII